MSREAPASDSAHWNETEPFTFKRLSSACSVPGWAGCWTASRQQDRAGPQASPHAAGLPDRWLLVLVLALVFVLVLVLGLGWGVTQRRQGLNWYHWILTSHQITQPFSAWSSLAVLNDPSWCYALAPWSHFNRKEVSKHAFIWTWSNTGTTPMQHVKRWGIRRHRWISCFSTLIRIKLRWKLMAWRWLYLVNLC